MVAQGLSIGGPTGGSMSGRYQGAAKSRSSLMWEMLRSSVVRQAYGTVLEIGIGEGANLRYYGTQVTELTAMEPRQEAIRKMDRRTRNIGFPVELLVGEAERLPFEDSSFDTVVATFVMCSVRDVRQSLAEIARVLRPGGQYLFLEHVRHDSLAVRAWQNIAAPFTRRFDHNCHPNRDFTGSLVQAGLAPAALTNANLHPLTPMGALFRPNVFGRVEIAK